MIDKLKDRAMRTMAAALLNSSLTTQELRRLAEELKLGSFSYDLARMLQGAISSLEFDPIRNYSISNPARDAETLDLVAKKKVTRDQLLLLMREAFEGPIKPPLNIKANTRTLVSNFLDRASDEQRSRFITLLDRFSNSDPYLKGISNR